MNIVDQIISSYSNNKSLYIGEKITITEHMIQTAMLAEKNNCSSSLICSSLLHDYGHFILENPDDLVNKEKDGKHEDVGYKFLKKYFVKDVVEPIKYHVKAKRYLAKYTIKTKVNSDKNVERATVLAILSVIFLGEYILPTK